MSNLVRYVETRRPNLSFLQKAFGAIEQVRSYWQGPYPLRDPKLAELFGAGYQTTAGVVVTPENAFTFSAVYDAVNQISSDIAKLPLILRKRLQGGGSEEHTDSKVYRLLKDEANPEMTAMVFRRTLTAHALTLKGGFAEIERDGAGRPSALWPITPDRIRPFRRELRRADGGISYGPLQYMVDEKTVLDSRDVIHLHGLGYDGILGYSVLALARQAIGLALAAEKHGSAFFANGAGFGGILTNDQLGLGDDEEKEKDLRKTLSEYQTSANKLRQLLVLFGPGRWEYKATGISARDSQMDELRDKQVEEVARFFNIPLYKLKVSKPGAVSYASAEMADLDYYKSCLLTWITLWEQELNRKVIAPLEARQQFVKHNEKAFLRGDMKSRYDAYAMLLDKGVLCADDVLALEDMNPQPNGQGKLFLVQQAMIPKDQLAALVDSQITKNTQPKTPPAAPGSSADAAERVRQAEALVEEARAESQKERDARVALEATGQATAAELAAALAREQDANSRAVALAQLSEQLRGNLEASRTAEAAAVAALVEATAGKTTAELERDAARQAAEESREAAEAARRQVETAQAEVETAKASVIEAERLRDEAAALAAAAESRAEEAVRARAVAEETAAQKATESDEVRAAAERDRADAAGKAAELLAQVAAANESLESLGRSVVAAEEARTAAFAKASESERLAVEAEARATHAEEVRAQAEATAADALNDRDRRDVEKAQAQREAREAEQRAAAAEAEGHDAAAAIIAAHRSLVVHVMRKAIERETDRAHRAQGSREKFRAWIDKWYDSHEALMAAELLPVVQVHLAFVRSTEDPGDTARALAHQHVVTSQQQLEAVLDGDAGAFAGSLAQLLLRWQAERTETIANALFEKELEYVRRRG